MAKWERYIVYPLLFVALFFGVARETRMLQAAESIVDEIRARRVVVVDEAGRERVVIRGDENGGQLEMFNKGGEKQVELQFTEGVGGSILIKSPLGSSLLNGRTLWLGESILWEDRLKALYLTAYLNTGGWALTQKLSQTSFTIDAGLIPLPAPDGVKLEVQVNTTCQPTWNFHLGQGRFSVSDREVRVAYEEAGNYVFEKYIQPAFPKVSKNEVKITFFIQGYEVGTWRNGVMKLKGE